MPFGEISPKSTLALVGVKVQLKVTFSFADREKAVVACLVTPGEMLQSKRLVALAEPSSRARGSNVMSEISTMLLADSTSDFWGVCASAGTFKEPSKRLHSKTLKIGLMSLIFTDRPLFYNDFDFALQKTAVFDIERRNRVGIQIV